MAQSRSFATIGPSIWNDLPQSLWLTLLSGSLPASFSLLKTFSYSRGLRTGSVNERYLLLMALYKLRNALRYDNPIFNASRYAGARQAFIVEDRPTTVISGIKEYRRSGLGHKPEEYEKYIGTNQNAWSQT